MTKRRSQQHTTGVPRVCFGDWCSVWARFVPFFLASLLSYLPWAVCVFGAVCGRLVLCSRASFSTALLPLLWVDDTVQDRSTTDGDRFTSVDQGEKAHAGVFKSSPSRMSDELTGTCSSQECSWQLDAGYSDVVSMDRRLHGLRATWQNLPTHGQAPHGSSAGGPG